MLASLLDQSTLNYQYIVYPQTGPIAQSILYLLFHHTQSETMVGGYLGNTYEYCQGNS